jgi:hypothetical protein
LGFLFAVNKFFLLKNSFISEFFCSRRRELAVLYLDHEKGRRTGVRQPLKFSL